MHELVRTLFGFAVFLSLTTVSASEQVTVQLSHIPSEWVEIGNGRSLITFETLMPGFGSSTEANPPESHSRVVLRSHIPNDGICRLTTFTDTFDFSDLSSGFSLDRYEFFAPPENASEYKVDQAGSVITVSWKYPDQASSRLGCSSRYALTVYAVGPEGVDPITGHRIQPTQIK